MISSLLQASERARQLGDLGGRVFDGLYGAVVRDLDGRDVSGDLPMALSQLSQRGRRASSGETTPLAIFLRSSLTSAITSPRASSASLAVVAAPSAESYA
jgi:hypothetical protein